MHIPTPPRPPAIPKAPHSDLLARMSDRLPALREGERPYARALAQCLADFAEQLPGQDTLLRTLEPLLRVELMGLGNPERPLLSLLLAGAPGDEPHRIAKALSHSLFGTSARVIVWQLPPDTTATPSPSDDTLPLPDLHPFSVVLVSGLEKSTAAHRQGLQGFLEGSSFRDPEGNAHTIHSLLFIIACPVDGERYLPLSLTAPDPSALELTQRETRIALERKLSYSFLSLLDAVEVLTPLSLDVRRQRALLALNRTLQHLQDYLPSVQIEESVLDWLALWGWDPLLGLLHLESFVDRSLRAAASDYLSTFHEKTQSAILLKYHHNTLQLLPVRDKASEARSLIPFRPPSARRTETTAPTEVQVLRQLSERLLQNIARRDALIEADRRKHQQLQESLTSPHVWQDLPALRPTLNQWKALTCQLNWIEHLLQPVKGLRTQLEGRLETPEALHALEHHIRLTQEALTHWDAQLNDLGTAPLWMVLTSQEAQASSAQWLLSVVQLEKLYAERHQLRADVVAFELMGDAYCRVVLRIGGPGTARILSMEEGLHRLYRPHGDGLQVRIQLVPAGDASVALRPTQPVPRPQLPFALEPTPTGPGLHRMRLELLQRRQMIDFVGSEVQSLSRLLHDLELAWREADTAPELVRLYGSPQAGALDPRTGASVSRMQDALAGLLDPFLEAWQTAGG